MVSIAVEIEKIELNIGQPNPNLPLNQCSWYLHGGLHWLEQAGFKPCAGQHGLGENWEEMFGAWQVKVEWVREEGGISGSSAHCNLL